MNELIDKFLFELFDGLRDKTTVLFGEFIADAQALAAIFMLLYFGVESFKMMSGDKKLEIIPLLRPFALGLVLMFWIPFINLISYPGELLTARSKAMFTNQIEEVELLSRNRYALIDSVAVELLHTSLEVERAENEVKDKKWYDFSIDFSAIGDKIAGLYGLCWRVGSWSNSSIRFPSFVIPIVTKVMLLPIPGRFSTLRSVATKGI